MATDIGSFIVQSPDIRHGRPRVVGTGITVHRIAIWYRLGYRPEQIVTEFYPHISLAQIFAALSYYFANQLIIDAEIAAEEAEADRLEAEFMAHRKTSPPTTPSSSPKPSSPATYPPAPTP